MSLRESTVGNENPITAPITGLLPVAVVNGLPIYAPDTPVWISPTVYVIVTQS